MRHVSPYLPRHWSGWSRWCRADRSRCRPSCCRYRTDHTVRRRGSPVQLDPRHPASDRVRLLPRQRHARRRADHQRTRSRTACSRSPSTPTVSAATREPPPARSGRWPPPGFIVAAPHFNINMGDISNGNLGRDVSEIITRTLALNTSATDPLRGHINTTAGVGAYGHSAGGMTTHTLLTNVAPDRGSPRRSRWPAWTWVRRPPRSAPRSCSCTGTRTPTCPYSSARQAYRELPAPKAFLTFRGGNHGG